VRSFFFINGTNNTQEDVLYHNELYTSVEFEGPIIDPGYVFLTLLMHVNTPYSLLPFSQGLGNLGEA
jgi:hypothetical protein